MAISAQASGHLERADLILAVGGVGLPGMASEFAPVDP